VHLSIQCTLLTHTPEMVQFRQCTMLDCPAVLHSGADLMISLCVYALPSAFRSPEVQEPAESGRVIFEEGRETLDEQILRERKKALLRLFDAISLRPRNGTGFTKYRDEQIKQDSIQNMRNGNDRVKKTEIVGDGEEIEVEEGEELSENDLDTIYKKWAIFCL
jgi:DNA repair protein RAD5